MTPEDCDLTAAQAGDHAAFARIYDRHAALVVSYCRSRGDGDGSDATQEVFLRSFRVLGEVACDRALPAWLLGVARRVCAERRRAGGRRERRESLAATNGDAFDPIMTPDDRASRSEQLARLTTAIEKLPDQQRIAIHLFYLQDCAAEAAAQTMGISRSGFYNLIAKARDRLATDMREANHERAVSKQPTKHS